MSRRKVEVLPEVPIDWPRLDAARGAAADIVARCGFPVLAEALRDGIAIADPASAETWRVTCRDHLKLPIWRAADLAAAAYSLACGRGDPEDERLELRAAKDSPRFGYAATTIGLLENAVQWAAQPAPRASDQGVSHSGRVIASLCDSLEKTAAVARERVP